MGNRNGAKFTRNLWKTDSKIDTTELRSKLKVIFYSSAQNTKSRRKILSQNIRNNKSPHTKKKTAVGESSLVLEKLQMAEIEIK